MMHFSFLALTLLSSIATIPGLVIERRDELSDLTQQALDILEFHEKNQLVRRGSSTCTLANAKVRKDWYVF